MASTGTMNPGKRVADSSAALTRTKLNINANDTELAYAA